MLAEVTVPLGHGLLLDGERQHEAVVRALTGADQARLADLVDQTTPAAAATALVSSATTRVGRIAPITPDLARLLSMGDRERILLALYRLSVGPRIDAVAPCARCGETLEVDLPVGELIAAAAGRDEPASRAQAGSIAGGRHGGGEFDLLPRPAGVASPMEEISIEADGRVWHVRVRPVNGGDLEHVALAHLDPRRAADALVERAVSSVATAEDPEVPRSVWWAALRTRLDEALMRLDPQAQATVAVACAACGAVTETVLDATTFALDALAGAPHLFQDVHRLARAYHWSEADILSLPVPRRRRYLELVAADGAPA
jgi:hypothetical protein